MRTIKKHTLTEFLNQVNKMRKNYGDMMITSLKDQKGIFKIQFSKHEGIYYFCWDASVKNWILTNV